MRARLAIASFALLLCAVPLGARAEVHPTHQVVLISENERLVAYDIDNHTSSTLVQSSDWVNGPPCFIPGDAQGRFLEADDNPDENGYNGDANPYFGLFDKNGTRDFDPSLGDIGRVGGASGMHDPAGCAFGANNNLFGVDVGTIHAPFIGDGQLVEFFAATNYTTFCVLDSALAQPGMVTFDATGGLLVPEAGFGQIDRYSNFPADAAHCSATATKDVWAHTAAMGIGTPIGITRAPGGGYAVTSVLVPPAIYHFTEAGVVDDVYALPGTDTGTPFGLSFDSNGDLYFADLGVRPFPLDGTDPSDPIDAAQDQGAFRVVRSGGLPVATALATGWNFPDGVTVVDASAVTL